MYNNNERSTLIIKKSIIINISGRKAQLVNTHSSFCDKKERNLFIMDEINRNPLRIIEDDVEVTITNSSDNSDDNDSSGEMFDFSASDIEELEGYKRDETESEIIIKKSDVQRKRNSLLIIEDDKDLIAMETGEDFNNNHRLSLQIESGDSDSLVMTNEAANRTIIRIGSSDIVEQHQQQQSFNNNNSINNCNDDDSHNETQSDDDNDVDEVDDSDRAIVNILGQINEIVGSKYVQRAKDLCVFVIGDGHTIIKKKFLSIFIYLCVVLFYHHLFLLFLFVITINLLQNIHEIQTNQL